VSGFSAVTNLVAGGKDRAADEVQAAAPDVLAVEAQHPQAALAQKAGSAGVVLHLVEVLTPVEFDNQAGGRAVEIHNERGDRRLAPPFPAAKPAAAQFAPETTFGVGLVDAESAGALESGLVGHGVERK
jgi:hypothetical protein